MTRNWFTASMALAMAATFAGPALGAGVQITHSKALAGNITPDDTAGYPITISTPGVYELAGNLVVAANKFGIHVTSANVTINLNGFTIDGANVASYGIVATLNNLTVENGTITRFKSGGIYGSGDHPVVDNMRVVVNSGPGVAMSSNFVNGRYARITNNTVANNLGYGITCGGNCLIAGNVVSKNGQIGSNWGIVIASGTVLGNTISDNLGYGIYSSGNTGYGNNSLLYNNNSGDQVNSSTTAFPLQPNACRPGACVTP